MTVLKTNRKAFLVALAIGMLALTAAPSRADIYGGTLTYPSGLVAGGNWAPVTGAASPSIRWTVTPVTGGFLYQYALTVPTPAASHFIIEVSENFTADSFWGLTWNGVAWPQDDVLFPFSEFDNNGNTGLNDLVPPGDWNNSIKIDDTTGTDITLEFYSSRVPVWGDFYAKGGSTSYVYNLGVNLPDGDDDKHIAVPDSVVPVPGAALLGILGLGVASNRLRRNRV